MTIVSRQGLITELLDRTELVKAGTNSFLRLSDVHLAARPTPERWSIAEIFSHLNLSYDKYIRIILSRVTLAPDHESDRYQSGWMGNWLYARIIPRPDGSMHKFRTPPSLYPQLNADGREEVEGFQRKCDALDDILRHSATKDIRTIRIPVEASRLFSLRLGDMLRVLVAHGERHLLQAQRVMLEVNEK